MASKESTLAIFLAQEADGFLELLSFWAARGLQAGQLTGLPYVRSVKAPAPIAMHTSGVKPSDSQFTGIAMTTAYRIVIEDWDGDGAIRIPDVALQELGLDVGDSLYLIEEFVGNSRCLVLSKTPKVADRMDELFSS
ncbi:hypothetical protein KU43P_41230 [Pseudomonas sp. KU43P]|nr:hypothetical protein KU43P_41230 [Pseudomonas sp. KU43P]